MLRYVLFRLFIVLLAGAVLGACGASATATAPAAASATPTQLPTPAPSATPTRTPVPTSRPTATPTPTPTPTPTLAPTLAPTGTIPAGTQVSTGSLGIRIELQQVTGGLETPVGIANAGDGSGRLFVVEKVGRIRIVQDGRLLDTPFLDITDRVGSQANEQGLLGLAFHPDYKQNGLFFVNYTDSNGDTVVARFSGRPGSDQADPGSQKDLLHVDQPAPNHNGGNLVFGPDGYLYIGLGDGGGGGDTYGNSQKKDTLLAKMLRIDVDGGDPYGVPEDNPFVGQAGVRPEIWAMGLRNPWRYSFDRGTGDLYIADVGQNKYEEIDVQPASGKGGENYGWVIMEGRHCFRDANCSQSGLTLPVAEYDHSQGCSVTGGYVYRGRQFPALDGVYLFADYCTGRFWGLANSGGTWQMDEVARTDISPTSFGQDESGELYVVDGAGGGLYRITAGGTD